jgi:hypothetical protein
VTDQEYLKYLRRRLRDVDPTAPLYDDTMMWEYTQDALRTMNARKVIGFSSYAVTIAAPLGIDPDLADDDGVLLAIRTAALLLRDLYTEKVRSGELGVTWESGLERESTIDMRKAFDAGIKSLDAEAEELTLIRNSATSGTRFH